MPAARPTEVGSLELAALRTAYESGAYTPADVVAAVYDRIEARGEDAVWISLVPREEALAVARALPATPASADAVATLPLFGVPFAVKDNIDVAGMLTTAACPEFAYEAGSSATLVTRLLAAGAILIGKTNLDQFATGLSGARSPYGIPANPFNDSYISGGSSSGSAVAVAAGLVSFAIGTDTAGSGRVPAALNSLVGMKPSRGLVSTAGLVPACRSLDCASVFALSVECGTRVLAAMAGPDLADPWSRALPVPPAVPASRSLSTARVAVPSREVWAAADAVGYVDVWDGFIARLVAAGAEVIEVDLDPFFEAGAMLYGGPWIAERLAAVEDFMGEHAAAVHPVVATLLDGGRKVSGTEAFRGLSRLMELRVRATQVLEGFDALVTPTAPTTFTIDAMLADPIARNAALGTFTTFTNLLDLAAVAVPAGFTETGLPFGVTVHGANGTDQALAAIASAMEGLVDVPLGATGLTRTPLSSTALSSTVPATALSPAHGGDGTLELAVVGAHLRGQPLHSSLLAWGAAFVRDAATVPEYALFALPGTTPPKPGLVRVGDGGSSIAVEVYAVPVASVGSLLATIENPLGLGQVLLGDGSQPHGFLCEALATASASDISSHGGWRAYLAATMGDVTTGD
ncbi:MAG: allophanate hydrolase [Actinobacteria bacterium HGW-Actinobacteria-4]|nr:MAG: allophanate hydrolase [Actinobacteria bacterium HGW-Actinobacteria-4]